MPLLSPTGQPPGSEYVDKLSSVRYNSATVAGRARIARATLGLTAAGALAAYILAPRLAAAAPDGGQQAKEEEQGGRAREEAGQDRQ